jgi:DNA invertase Pin-like site-specific DNA recombinase
MRRSAAIALDGNRAPTPDLGEQRLLVSAVLRRLPAGPQRPRLASSLELCGLVDARAIDLDGVYDPCRTNDRLLLGMKGSISEFELGVLRARMLDASRAKARRGELRIGVPIGYIWHREIGLGFDPDLRIQEAIRLIFARFRELGSGRQVFLSLLGEQVHSAVRRQEAGQLRVDADPLPQCHLRAQEPVLRGRLCLRQRREAHRDRRWT